MKYSLSKLEINGIKLYSEKNFIPEGTEERIAKRLNKKNDKGVYFETNWVLENDELFLSQFYNPKEASNIFYDCHRLNPFGKNSAKWINGHYNFFQKIGDSEGLQIEFSNGKMVNHRILFPFDFETFNFGKYLHSKYEDVIFGLNNETNFELYKNVAENLITFLLGEKEDSILFPNINIKSFEKDFGVVRNNPIKYLIIENMICFEETRLGSEFSLFVQFLLESSWKITRLISYDFAEADNHCSQFLNNDLNYIYWALGNVENFVLKNEFLESRNIKNFERFKVNRINNYIFQFSPQFSNQIINIDEEVKQFNNEKIKKLEEKFCVEDPIFVHTSKYHDILEKNKNHINKIITNKDESHNSFSYENIDVDREYYYTMTDGEFGEYEDFIENGGSIDDIDIWSRG